MTYNTYVTSFSKKFGKQISTFGNQFILECSSRNDHFWMNFSKFFAQIAIKVKSLICINSFFMIYFTLNIFSKSYSTNIIMDPWKISISPISICRPRLESHDRTASGFKTVRESANVRVKGGKRISPSTIDRIFDNSNRRQYGMGIVGRFFG